MEVGKRYYVINHAYYHFVGEVADVLGPRSVRFKNLAQVHSCGRPWSEFFRGGFKDDTQYDLWPDTTMHGFISVTDWNHPIPEAPRARNRR